VLNYPNGLFLGICYTSRFIGIAVICLNSVVFPVSYVLPEALRGRVVSFTAPCTVPKIKYRTESLWFIKGTNWSTNVDLCFLNKPPNYIKLIPEKPNVVIDCLILLLHIREVQGSNLGSGDWLSRLRFCVVFLSSSRRMPGQYIKKVCHYRFLPNSLQFIFVHLSPYHRRYMVLLLRKRHKINYQLTFRNWNYGTEIKNSQ
jgi:hypothetical protein